MKLYDLSFCFYGLSKLQKGLDNKESHTVYGKTFEGQNFRGFRGFLALPQKFSHVRFAYYWHLFIILMKRCHLQLVPRKFSPSKVLPYTVYQLN